MNAYVANLSNAVILFLGSGWIYTATGYKPIFLSLLVSVLLLALNSGVKGGIKSQSNVALLLTILGLWSLYAPTLIAYTNHNTFDLGRLGIMNIAGIISTIVLLINFFKK
jgi:hypothetical protein